MDGSQGKAVETSRTISRSALEAELGEKATKAFLGGRLIWRWRQKNNLAPLHESLLAGDVILSKKTVPVPHQREIEKQQLQKGCSSDASVWTHAALYVGSLHVLETGTGGLKVNPLKLRSTNERRASTQYLVLRHRSEKYEERRSAMVRRALLEYHIRPQEYGFGRAIALKLGLQSDRPANLEKYAMCSEYVLNCLARGAQTLTPERFQLDQEPSFFLPADFFDHPDFDHQLMSYYALED